MNYSGKIKKIIDEINFIPLDTYVNDSYRGRYIARGKVNDFEVVLKIVSEQQNNIFERLTREKEAYLILRDSGLFDESDLATILDINHKHGMCWIVRKFLSGETLSITRRKNESALFDKDIIRDKYINSSKEICMRSSEIIKKFRKLRFSDIQKFDLNSKYVNRYPFDIEQWKLDDFYSVIKNGREVLEFYNKHKSNYCRADKLVFSSGDFVPPNILVEDKKILLYDFEWLYFDNKAMDLANFWLSLWRYPLWQADFISNFEMSNEDKRDFSLSVIRIIISSNWFYRFNKETEKHQWIKYLEEYESILLSF
jgi:thiamine kinase-like enzyme